MRNKSILKEKMAKLEYIILSIILLLGLISRIYKINSPIADWHSFRQADTASVSRIYFEEGVNLLYPRYYDISTTQSGLFNPKGYRFVEFPIYNFISVILGRIFPMLSLEVWGRLVSVFSALISGLFIFSLGKRFISNIGGLLASAFYLLTPFNIYFTRVILPEPLAVMFALFSLWSYVKFIDFNKRVWLYTAALLMAGGILIKPYVAFYSIAMIYLVIKKYGRNSFLAIKDLLLALVLALAPFILWRFWMGRFPEGIPFWKWTLNGDGIRFKPAFWYWIFAERLGKLILGIGGLIPFIFGLLARNKGKSFYMYFLLGMFLYVSVFATANVKHDYYQTITIPAISLVLSSGSIYLWNAKSFNKALRRVTLLFGLFLMFLIGLFQVKEYYKINHPEIIIAGAAVDRIVPKDALVIAPYNGDTAFLYQTKRRGWPVIDRPLNELIDRGASYLVSVNLDDKRMQEIENEFKVIEKTNSYVIVNLKNPNN